MLTDRVTALEYIREWVNHFHACSNELKNERSFILDAVKLVGGVLEFARDDFKDDEEIVFEAVKQNNTAMAFASVRLKKDEVFVKSLINEGCFLLTYNPSILTDNESIVLHHVQKYGRSLEFASPRLQGNFEIVKAAMIQDKNAIEYSDTSSMTIEELKKLIAIDGNALKYLNDELKDDEAIALEAIANSDSASIIKYVSNRLQNDRAFLLKAVKVNGLIIRFTEDCFRKDKELVLEAGRQNKSAFRGASKSLDEDKDFIMRRVSIDPKSLIYVDKFLDDIDVAIAAAQVDGCMALQISPLSNNPKVVMVAVKQNGLALKHSGKVVKSNEDIVLEAVKQNPEALKYADESLTENPVFMRKVNPFLTIRPSGLFEDSPANIFEDLAELHLKVMAKK